jgi:hypothetical protein
MSASLLALFPTLAPDYQGDFGKVVVVDDNPLNVVTQGTYLIQYFFTGFLTYKSGV